VGGVGGGVEMAKVAISATGVDGGRDDTDVDRWMPRKKLMSFRGQLLDKEIT